MKGNADLWLREQNTLVDDVGRWEAVHLQVQSIET